jgi:hypothetical protein
MPRVKVGPALPDASTLDVEIARLTLNVLLSFAQFEREVTSERIRDKITASKRKGLWVGGMAPLGYDTKERKITVNDAEADRVRTIFRSYLTMPRLRRSAIAARAPCARRLLPGHFLGITSVAREKWALSPWWTCATPLLFPQPGGDLATPRCSCLL